MCVNNLVNCKLILYCYCPSISSNEKNLLWYKTSIFCCCISLCFYYCGCCSLFCCCCCCSQFQEQNWSQTSHVQFSRQSGIELVFFVVVETCTSKSPIFANISTEPIQGEKWIDWNQQHFSCRQGMINKENINTEEAKRMNAFSGKQFSQNIKIEEKTTRIQKILTVLYAPQQVWNIQKKKSDVGKWIHVIF